MMIAEYTETRFFEFENDFVGGLKCIPMIVRYKLDVCRIKLKLEDWVKLTYQEKNALAQLPCYQIFEINLYISYVNKIVHHHTGLCPSPLGKVNDTWTDISTVPSEVIIKALEWKCAPPTTAAWQRLEMLERFALVKLSRSGHEGNNFPKAMREFGL